MASFAAIHPPSAAAAPQPDWGRAFDTENRLGADSCAQEAREVQNVGISQYVTTYLRPEPACEALEVVNDRALQTRARQPWLGFGLDTCHVDDDSRLRQSKDRLTNTRGRQQLSVRTFEAGPDLSRGQQRGVANDDGFGVVGSLRAGMDTSVLKSCSRTTEKDFQRFQPNVCPVGVEHIVPTFWVHGGASSRDIARSEGFLKAVGRA